MASSGEPEPYSPQAEGLTVAIVSTRWNARIVDTLRERALATARELGAKADEYLVDGAMELPVVVQACARRYDAVVALGCVIRGKTPHFEVAYERSGGEDAKEDKGEAAVRAALGAAVELGKVRALRARD